MRNANAERVYRLDEKYYYRSSSGDGLGPFDSLQEPLLDNQFLEVTSTIVSVNCPELSASAYYVLEGIGRQTSLAEVEPGLLNWLENHYGVV